MTQDMLFAYQHYSCILDCGVCDDFFPKSYVFFDIWKIWQILHIKQITKYLNWKVLIIVADIVISKADNM